MQIILMNSQIPTKLIGSMAFFQKVRKLSYSQLRDKAISKKRS